MIKFFRRIRSQILGIPLESSEQKLLFENKLSKPAWPAGLPTGQAGKYLIYAIGEIFLVMIGILLALQVNNWNTQRINSQLEKKILRQLHTEFEQNKGQFNHVTQGRLKSMEFCNKIIDMFPIDLARSNLDSISYYLKTVGFRATFDPANGAINTLNSSATFEMISDEQLRSLLIGWKDNVADYKEDEAIADYHLVNQWDPYMNKRIMSRRRAVPLIEDIYDDRVDLSFLTTIEFENMVIRRMLNLRRGMEIEQRPGQRPGERITEIERMNSTIDSILMLTEKY